MNENEESEKGRFLEAIFAIISRVEIYLRLY